jgi:hypothetical protein
MSGYGDIIDRLYAIEAARHLRERVSMRWRMSPDVAAACATAAGWPGVSVRTGRSTILGYPVVVDDTLPPDSLDAEDAPRELAPLPPDSLDAAWAEAEAALPEGWALRIMACMHDGISPWKVSAGENLAAWADVPVYVEGDPVAALRALAAKLREKGAR